MRINPNKNNIFIYQPKLEKLLINIYIRFHFYGYF